MIIILIQVLLIIFTATSGIISQRADYKVKTKRKRAFWLMVITVLFAIGAIYIAISQYEIDSTSKTNLSNSLIRLQGQNNTLSKQLDNRVNGLVNKLDNATSRLIKKVKDSEDTINYKVTKANDGINYYQRQTIYDIAGTSNPPHIKLFICWAPGKLKYDITIFNKEKYPIKNVKYSFDTNTKSSIDINNPSLFIPAAYVPEIEAKSYKQIVDEYVPYGIENLFIILTISNQHWKYFMQCNLEKNGKYYEVKNWTFTGTKPNNLKKLSSLFKIDNKTSESNKDQWTMVR